ncbi:outer membrane protein transport protein [uncultured Umboniibacter sp.]|uniref:OmpP1/FadL family transporter n=1 Tax=uncultured Umboniibacter sp. TaxID=1798917 RepID=UPI00261C2EF4|nr:outer membrane protein transport protein [uncultured Umboniibacter sp.]
MNMKKISTAIALTTLSSGSLAAGFQLAEHSAAGLGRAFAGEGAVADSAAVIARNPAAMSLFKTVSLSGGISYVDPNVNIEGTNTFITTSGLQSIEANADDVAPAAIIPNAYIIVPLNDKWAFGLALNSHFGLKTDYPTDFEASESAGVADIATYNINPQVSYRINDMITLGAGVSVIYGHAEFGVTNSQASQANISASIYQSTYAAGIAQGLNPIQAAAQAAAVTGAATPEVGTELAHVEGDGWTWGYNLGVMLELTENTRLGLTYRSEIDMEFEGDLDGWSPDKLNPPTSYDGSYTSSGTAQIDLPSMIELSLHTYLTDSISMQASWQQIGWSSFETLEVELDNGDPNLVLAKNYWDDTNRYAVGFGYDMNSALTFRVGYALDESPVGDTYRNLAIPDSERTWITAGMTWNLSNNSSMDFGFARVTGADATIDYTSSTATVYNGEIAKGDANIASVSYNYSF